MLQSQKVKGLVLSRYPHSDPQKEGWDHKKQTIQKKCHGAARKAFLGCFYNKFLAKNFRDQRNIWKGSPVFPDGMFQAEICVPFLQSHLWYRGRFSVNGTDLYKW